jgi:hypothetical protein
MTLPLITPLNDFVASVTIMDVDSAGVETPVTTGTVTAFLATSRASDATAADPSLSVSASYSGADGVWLIRFDAATLTLSLLESLFTPESTYLIVQLAGAVRVWKKLRYLPSRPAE